MLSRVADSLYWMSRYLERAEHTARVLDVNFSMTLDPSRTSEEAIWTRALAALGHPRDLAWKGDSYELVRTLTYQADHPASITASISAARENARQVREEISSEQWQQLNRMYHRVTERPSEADPSLQDFYLATLDDLHLFEGVTNTTMSHGEGWHFIQVGRAIERASSLSALLLVFDFDVPHGSQGEIAGSHQFLEWVGLLRCCSAFEAYCNVYTADFTQSQILEFLLLNKEFPHSVRYSVDQLRTALLALEQQSGHQAAAELNRVAGRLQASLDFTEISEVLAQKVASYLGNISSQCRRIHSLLYRCYIQYSVETALAM